MGDIVKTVLQKNHVREELCCEVEQVLEELGFLEAIQTFSSLQKGMTNQLFHFSTLDGEYLLRLPGAGTEQIINRHHEVAV